jgi:phosphopantetheinyl transferase
VSFDPAGLLLGLNGGCPEIADLRPPRWLSSEETNQFHRLVTTGRRAEWLCGRWMAKSTVAVMAGMSSAAASLRDVEIVVGERGKPMGRLPGPLGASLMVELSLSHCPGMTVCGTLAVGVAGQVGVDAERVDPEILEIVDRFTLPAERCQLAGAGDEAAAAALLWSLKEAAIKCLGGRVVRRKAFRVECDWQARAARVILLDPLAVRHFGRELVAGFDLQPAHVLAWTAAPAWLTHRVTLARIRGWWDSDRARGQEDAGAAICHAS